MRPCRLAARGGRQCCRPRALPPPSPRRASGARTAPSSRSSGDRAASRWRAGPRRAPAPARHSCGGSHATARRRARLSPGWSAGSVGSSTGGCPASARQSPRVGCGRRVAKPVMQRRNLASSDRADRYPAQCRQNVAVEVASVRGRRARLAVHVLSYLRDDSRSILGVEHIDPVSHQYPAANADCATCPWPGFVASIDAKDLVRMRRADARSRRYRP